MRKFAAAQVAEKWCFGHMLEQAEFAAAQVAEKDSERRWNGPWVFAAAQVAEKIAAHDRRVDLHVRCRAGS